MEKDDTQSRLITSDYVSVFPPPLNYFFPPKVLNPPKQPPIL